MLGLGLRICTVLYGIWPSVYSLYMYCIITTNLINMGHRVRIVFHIAPYDMIRIWPYMEYGLGLPNIEFVN